MLKILRLALRSHPVIGLISILWATEILDQLGFAGRLDHYGITPRQLIGLRGIILAPFLHGGWSHLLSNTLPLWGLSWVILHKTPTTLASWLKISLGVSLTTGLGTWLLAASGSIHIGASGLVAGYLGYLLQHSLKAKAWGQSSLWLSLSLLFMAEGSHSTSWHSHLLGFAGGVLAARALFTPKESHSGTHDQLRP